MIVYYFFLAQILQTPGIENSVLQQFLEVGDCNHYADDSLKVVDW